MSKKGLVINMKNIKKLIVSKIVSAGDNLKPILTKILPKKILKKAKVSIINSAFNKKNYKRISYRKNAYPFGVNLFGYIKAQMGLGEGARLIAKALSKTHIPFGIIDTKVGNPFNHEDNSFNNKIIKKPVYSINIFHINPEQFPSLEISLPQNTWDKRYNIGIWLWELAEFPKEWENAFKQVDEIWAPSKFCCGTFKKSAPVPVTLIPYGIEPDFDNNLSREYFHLPENIFLFLVMFDVNSTLQRKNPIGAIKAFKKAFSKENKKVGIVIKINNANSEALNTIKSELKGYKNVYIINKTLSKTEVNTLIRLCDTFVSLHRSEGFGLVIAEAMYLKTPVIATNYSANVDFMSTDTACCVDYTLIKIDRDYNMYKLDQMWAEPDIVQASVFMKILFSDKNYRNELTINAYSYITSNFSVKLSANKIAKRINKLLRK